VDPSLRWGDEVGFGYFHAAMQPCVYIVCNHRHGMLYIGVTSNLARRAYEHRESLLDGFTKRYGLKRLVWYEQHETIEAAIAH
jgi:putative endonuclease